MDATMMVSFVVPAHNEAACLPGTLQAIHDSAHASGRPYEIVVVNDASTDATSEIARQNGARVVDVNHRQIAATRNAGARASNGGQIIFVDADTTVNPRAVAGALRAMDRGAVGGGAPTWLGINEAVPLYVRAIALIAVVGAKFIGLTGGAFMFCTRAAFQATGGFNEKLYWGEEGGFGLALKREGRFVVLWKPVLTSGRRFRTTTGVQVLTTVARAMLSPRKMFTRRSSVQKIWYDSDRSRDHMLSSSLVTRISNGIALVVMITMMSGPFWGFVPDSLTPLPGIPGIIRLVIGLFLCHAGLIFWPIAIILLLNLLRQKHFAGALRSLLLITFFSWQAWCCTRGAIWNWERLYHWLA